jgi:preprotein translocase subunit YajC
MLAASASYDLITSVLPFLILLGFWTFVQRRARAQGSTPQQVLDKLEEIRVEVVRLRQAVEEREPEEARFGFRS